MPTPMAQCRHHNSKDKILKMLVPGGHWKATCEACLLPSQRIVWSPTVLPLSQRVFCYL